MSTNQPHSHSHYEQRQSLLLQNQPTSYNNQSQALGNKIRSHGCTFNGCGKAFATIAHMKRHLKTHSGLQPYECHYCAKRFGRSDVRNKHVQSTHEGPEKIPGSTNRRRRTITEADVQMERPDAVKEETSSVPAVGKVRSYSMPDGFKRPPAMVKAEPISPVLPMSPMSSTGTALPGLSSFGSYRPPRQSAFEETPEDVQADEPNGRGYDHPTQMTPARTVSFMNYMPPPSSASSMSTSSAGGLPSSASISSGLSYRSPTNNQLPPIKWDGGYYAGSNDQRQTRQSREEAPAQTQTPSYMIPEARPQLQQSASSSSSSALAASYRQPSYHSTNALPLQSQSLPHSNQFFGSRPILYGMESQNTSKPTENYFGSSWSSFQPGHASSLSNPPSYSLPLPTASYGQHVHSATYNGDSGGPPSLNLYIPRTSTPMYMDGPMSAPAPTDHIRYNSIPDLGSGGYTMTRSASNNGERSDHGQAGTRYYDDYMKSIGYRSTHPFGGRS